MNKNAIFSTITGFFLVVVIVFGILIFIGIYNAMIKTGSASLTDLQKYDDAKRFKDSLLICHAHTSLKNNILENDANAALEEHMICKLGLNIKGYKVEQKEFGGCEQKTWTIGNTQETSTQILVYNILVIDDETGRNCISRLLIHI